MSSSLERVIKAEQSSLYSDMNVFNVPRIGMCGVALLLFLISCKDLVDLIQSLIHKLVKILGPFIHGEEDSFQFMEAKLKISF